MKIRPLGLAVALAVVVAGWESGVVRAVPAPGDATAGTARRTAPRTRAERDARVQAVSQSRRIDVNSINMFVTNFGTFANDIENQGNSGLFFPKGTIRTSVYQSGIWLAAKVGSEVRVAAAEYSQEFEPGIMVGTAPDDPTRPEYIVYKVARFTGNPSDTDHVERDPAAVARDRTLDPIAHHSWSEYVNGAGPHGAPIRTYTFPHPTNPGETVDVLGPDMKGDQMLWCVYNDANPAAHINRVGRTAPLGVEIQQSTFAFDRTGALGATVFLEFKVINKGGNQLDSVFVQMWSDPDLGGAGDDLVGCDTTLSLGYIYNATNTDQQYSDRPPAVGYDFFQGPKVGGVPLPLTSFIYYFNGIDPQNANETYCYMRGYQRDCMPFLDPGDNPTKFYAWGDPVAGTGFLDTNPSDRRFMMNSGPFNMAPGDTQVIVGAIIVAQGGDRLSSISGLKFFDVQAQKAFDVDFDLPPPPPQPRVTFSTDHERVNLLWDSGSRFNYTPAPGWAFEGYNVYQGASVSGPWERLRTFDLVNTIKDVRDSVFDVETGLIIADEPVAFGGDNGVVYTFSTTQDAIRGGSLKDATTYFFAVTAYSVNENPPPGFDKVLETSIQPQTIEVRRPPSGTNVAAARVNQQTVVRASTVPPPTTDHVVVDVVDPGSITGHTYAVSYSPLVPPVIIGADTVNFSWSLKDQTTGQTLISNQILRTDTPEYAPVDGMVIKLRESQGVDPPTDPLNDIYYTPFDSDMPFASVEAGLHYFHDGFGYAVNFFGHGIDPTVSPGLFPSVELRFGTGQRAYRFFRDETSSGGAPGTGRGYTYGGFQNAPCQAWDIDSNTQLELAFVERRVTDAAGLPSGSQPATHNGLWEPDDTELGGREYIFVSARPYTGNPAPELATDNAVGGVGAPPADEQWLYAGWLRKVGATQSGDKFVIQTGGNRKGTENDTLVFSTVAPPTNLVELQKANLDKIRVVPNPYYSKSSYEVSAFNRIVKFINMPEEATVRIYNLSGQLVRTLRKTDLGSSILEWDLLNENRLPVASGVYVYHIEVPGAGDTVGRMAVFIQKERLTNF